MDIKIAPSILSSDFGKLNEEVASIEEHADMLHVDVMDGHFVPNLTFGAPVVKWIKTDLPMECHLMIENPEKYIEDFVKAGADIITVHQEACDDLGAVIDQIKSHNIKAGVSIKPGTDIKVLQDYLDDIDMILVMSVEPGFGGQKFMPNALEKIKWIREKSPEMDIAVDGGINDETAKLCIEAGANILVAGSYIFKAEDRNEAIGLLRGSEGYSGT